MEDGCSAEERIPCDGKPPQECLFARVSSKAPRAVHEAFRLQGWYPVSDAPQQDECSTEKNPWWSIAWKGHFKVGEYERALPHQRINHFPKASSIARKDHLVRGMRKAVAVHGSIYNIVPQAFILPSEYTKFCDAYAEQPEDSKATWICKPHNSSQGRKIFIIQDLNDLRYDSQYVIQRYIERPLLISGYKFDLRIYVLCCSVHPLKVFIYQDGLARFGTDKYDMSSLDNLYSHLTNTSINKKVDDKSRDYCAAIGGGCKWSLKQLEKYTEQVGASWEKLWQRVQNVCVLTMMLLVHSVPVGTDACFELFGVDVIIDDQLKPWVLEVNSGPAMGLDEEVDRAVKLPLLQDAIKLLGCSTGHRDAVVAQTNASASKRKSRVQQKPIAENDSAGSKTLELGNFAQAFPFDSESARLSRRMADDASAFKQVVDLIRAKEQSVVSGTKVHIRSSSASSKSKSRTQQPEGKNRSHQAESKNCSQQAESRPPKAPVNRKHETQNIPSNHISKSKSFDRVATRASGSSISSGGTLKRSTREMIKSYSRDTHAMMNEASTTRTSCGLKASTLEAMLNSRNNASDCTRPSKFASKQTKPSLLSRRNC